MLSLFASEIIFRIFMGINILDMSVLRILLTVNIIALLLSALSSLFGRIAGNILTLLFSLAFQFYMILQANLYSYLGTFVSFKMTGTYNVVREYLADFMNHINWMYLLIAVPSAVLLIFYVFIDYRIKVLQRNDEIDFADKFDSEERKKLNDQIFARRRKHMMINSKVNAIIVAAILCGVYYYFLGAPFMASKVRYISDKEIFNTLTNPSVAVARFGVVGYGLDDLRLKVKPYIKTFKTDYDDKYTIADQVSSDYIRRVDDYVWRKVADGEKNQTYKTLNNYLLSKEVVDKNDLTEIFRNKNVIIIQMSSVNNMIINEEYFPNIYKLYSEGWSWKNSYSSRSICSTADSEFSAMTSLYTFGDICTLNNYPNNIYSESLLNQFAKENYSTMSFHNYTDTFYKRSTTHVNMGAKKYYGVQDLSIPYSNQYSEWPSDITLMEKVLQFTKDEKRFASWVIPVSTSMSYSESTIIGDKNLDLFMSTNYNTSLKRYLSKLKELDDALGVLIDGLKKQGKFDNTVLVLYSDHYPYGLDRESINNYFKEEDLTKNREIDKTPFIIYSTNIQSRVYEEYTTPINIAPTVANLFGFTFDPRFYQGFDILTKGYENRAVFSDGSWQDAKGYYDAINGKFLYNSPNNTYTEEELAKINKDIYYRIYMSNLMVKSNYFAYLEKAKDEYKVKDLDNE
jgi:phosphoglycerol transferase MdoB-like AlkP superfamily enzyme